MHIELDAAHQQAVRAALLGPGSDALIDLVFRLNLRSKPGAVPRATLDKATELGWIDPQGQQLTEMGWLVADPLREYRFWLDRGRRTHGEDAYDLLAPARYEGKEVLEAGSGFGCNLFSLSRVPGRFVGLEPVSLYRQFTPILAEREGIPAPQIVPGTAERLPFPDRSFDIVLCYSAHQYMDVRVALREMGRVLRPGGQLQLIGGTLEAFAVSFGRRVLRERSLGKLKHYGLTLLNTLSYQTLGRRAFVPGGAAATTAPIYPTYAAMGRWIGAAGLRLRPDLVRHFHETCFVADKPAA